MLKNDKVKKQTKLVFKREKNEYSAFAVAILRNAQW